MNLKYTKKRNWFNDVRESDWFFENISAAYQNGIVGGYGSDIVKPYNPITREESMVIISRSLRTGSKDITIPAEDTSSLLSQFKDTSVVDKLAIDSVAVCIKNKITVGTNGNLNPDGNITRAQTSAIVVRMLALFR